MHNTSPPKIVRDAIGLITELILTDRFLRLTTTLCAGLAKKIPTLIQEYVTDAEHIPIDLPGLTVEKAELFAKQKQTGKTRYGGKLEGAVTELQKQLAAVKKTEEFFENRIFGQKIWPYCKRVEGKIQQGQSVYEIVGKLKHPYLKKGDSSI